MIFIITGATHCGKTLFAQKLSEETKFPYYSIDHIKIGLIRSKLTALTPQDDKELTPFLWGIVSEMIKTAVENCQNAVFEGCYIPFNWRASFSESYLKEIRFVCLAFSDEYIEKNTADINAFGSVIEKRLYSSTLSTEFLKEENRWFIDGFSQSGEKVCIIKEDYTNTLNRILRELTEKNRWIIKTERLYLRELNHGDFESLYKVLGDSDVYAHYPYSFDENRVRNWIAKNINRYSALGFGLWAVCLQDTGELIGDCGITLQCINGENLPEIGYHIRKDMQRHGYGKEAASAVRDWFFEHTPCNRVYSYMKTANLASAATAVSYGCKKTDEYTDAENESTSVYSLSRDEWQKIKEKN